MKSKLYEPVKPGFVETDEDGEGKLQAFEEREGKMVKQMNIEVND